MCLFDIASGNVCVLVVLMNRLNGSWWSFFVTAPAQSGLTVVGICQLSVTIIMNDLDVQTPLDSGDWTGSVREM